MYSEMIGSKIYVAAKKEKDGLLQVLSSDCVANRLLVYCRRMRCYFD